VLQPQHTRHSAVRARRACATAAHDLSRCPPPHPTQPTAHAGARNLRQAVPNVCSAVATSQAVATNGSSSTSAAHAQAICDALAKGDTTAIAQAVSSASGPDAEAVANAIAQAAAGGECACGVGCARDVCGRRLRLARMRARTCHAARRPSCAPMPAMHTTLAGFSQASAVATAEAIYQALTCNCACEGPTARALSQAAAVSSGCGNVAQALSGAQRTLIACCGCAGIVPASRLLRQLISHCAPTTQYHLRSGPGACRRAQHGRSIQRGSRCFRPPEGACGAAAWCPVMFVLW
jgi:hypothetical protein